MVCNIYKETRTSFDCITGVVCRPTGNEEVNGRFPFPRIPLHRSLVNYVLLSRVPMDSVPVALLCSSYSGGIHCDDRQLYSRGDLLEKF